jgi:hypothetical protein
MVEKAPGQMDESGGAPATRSSDGWHLPNRNAKGESVQSRIDQAVADVGLRLREKRAAALENPEFLAKEEARRAVRNAEISRSLAKLYEEARRTEDPNTRIKG